MNLSFQLTFPKVNTWDGNFTGSDKNYIIAKSVSKIDYNRIMGQSSTKSFSYDFGDGWIAKIEIKKIDKKQVKNIQKTSDGFMNYEWMADSIINFGEILNDEQRIQKLIDRSSNSSNAPEQ